MSDQRFLYERNPMPDRPKDLYEAEELIEQLQAALASKDAEIESLRADQFEQAELVRLMHDQVQSLDTALATKDAELAKLSDPNAVHMNMLRGTIAKPSWDQIVHLYPEEFQAALASKVGELQAALATAKQQKAEWEQTAFDLRAEIERLRAQFAALENAFVREVEGKRVTVIETTIKSGPHAGDTITKFE